VGHKAFEIDFHTHTTKSSNKKNNLFINNQGWLWLENKITENQWIIAETIYTPFQKVQMSCHFQISFPAKNSWIQLNN
jgi:hypothetical protein